MKITDKGISIVDDISERMNAMYTLWKDKLSEKEAQKLSELLDKLRS